MASAPEAVARAALVAVAALGLAACQDETISGYADRDTTYRLTEFAGASFPAGADIRFPERGRVEGNGPCNAFSARQSLPLPWFGVEDLAVTRRTCPDAAAESRFFETLQSMTLAEVRGGVLILSNDAGQQMVFRAD